MKKAVVICMLLLYGAVTIGATVHIHYCMGRFTGISFVDGKNAVCNTCGMAKDKAHGCCREECKQFKIAADQLLTNNTYTSQDVNSYAILPPVAHYAVQTAQPAPFVKPVSHAPPNRQLEKLYLQHNVWRI